MIHYFFNTGPAGFEKICRSRNYVDKSGLIQFINERIDKEGNLILVSRPRRFGKTYAAQMLKAYYTLGYETEGLFKEKKIGQIDPALTYHGAFDVIYIDMLKVRSFARSEQAVRNAKAKGRSKAPTLDWIEYLSDSIIQEVGDTYGKDVISEKSLPKTLLNTVQKTGRKFFWICDEWDNFFREPSEDPYVQQNYIEWLRSLFKDIDITATVFAGAYMTGILPMIKMKGESALTEFDNYSMFTPRGLASYIGFTEQEVRELLKRNPDCPISYGEMAEWYEGYAFPGTGPLFNPKSVINAIDSHFCEAYWADSASNEQFHQLVSLQRDSLRRDVEAMLRGEEVPVSMAAFDNDLRTLPGADRSGDSATLAAMVHMGYLSFRQETRSACIPNKELRTQFLNMLKDSTYPAIYRKIAEADRILHNTLLRNEGMVAEAFREIHCQYADPKAYNSEATLKETVDLAYYTAERFYIRMYELPSGEGYADMVLYPKMRGTHPLLIIELKKNRAVETGMSQIKARKYPERFKEYGGREILLVSISYDADKREKEHYCKIEKMVLQMENLSSRV